MTNLYSYLPLVLIHADTYLEEKNQMHWPCRNDRKEIDNKDGNIDDQCCRRQ